MTFLSIFAHNIGAPKYRKQISIEAKGESDSNTPIVGALVAH